jgi:hypothetical protein
MFAEGKALDFLNDDAKSDIGLILSYIVTAISEMKSVTLLKTLQNHCTDPPKL